LEVDYELVADRNVRLTVHTQGFDDEVKTGWNEHARSNCVQNSGKLRSLSERLLTLQTLIYSIRALNSQSSGRASDI